jgi:hypothetical protein
MQADIASLNIRENGRTRVSCQEVAILKRAEGFPTERQCGNKQTHFYTSARQFRETADVWTLSCSTVLVSVFTVTQGILRLRKEVPRIDHLHTSLQLRRFPLQLSSQSVYTNIGSVNHVTIFASDMRCVLVHTCQMEGTTGEHNRQKGGNLEHNHLHHPWVFFTWRQYIRVQFMSQ